MNLFKLLYKGFILCLLTSCVNHLEDLDNSKTNQGGDIPSSPNSGNIPIKISAPELHDRLRMISLEEALGLYIYTGTQTVKNDLYLDNIAFYSGTNGFKAKETQYYPDYEGKSRFYAYFPFIEKGFNHENNEITIKIQSDQSELKNFILSDFMTAEVANVTNGRSTAVHLPLKHKLAKLTVSIVPDNKKDLEYLLQCQPQVEILQSYTKAIYSSHTDEILQVDGASSIQMHGKWEEKDGVLFGKECILIPQIISKGNQFLNITINGKVQTCHLTQSIELEGGKISHIKLLYNIHRGISDVIPEINEWEEGNESEIIPTDSIYGDSISIKNIDFTQSYIYQVISNDTPVAEICLEFLKNEKIEQEAIVVYPIEEGNRIWEQGKILYLVGEKLPTNGGEIFWDINKNSFIYKEGNTPPWMYFFIDKNHDIYHDRPTNALELKLVPLTMTDQRNNESFVYPLVKIGTQVWMQDNLETSYYNDNTKITIKSTKDLQQTTEGTFIEDKHHFYNQSAILTNKLCPKGWKIGNEEEWEILKNYLNNNASWIKGKTNWNVYENVQALNNSGFNALPYGIFSQNKQNTQSVFDFKNKFVAYWMMNTENKIANHAIILRYDSNDIKYANHTPYSGYCIRCLQEDSRKTLIYSK